METIPISKQLQLRLFTIGLGSLQAQLIPHVTFEGKPVLSKLEPEILEQLADRGKGKYYMAEKWTSWELAKELISQIEKVYSKSQAMQKEHELKAIAKDDVLVDLYYQVPLGLALFFYFLNLLIPDVRLL